MQLWLAKLHYLIPVLTGALAFIGTAAAAAYARKAGMLDLPGERHSHRVATPRGGGAGPVLALLVCTPWILPGSPTSTFWSTCLLPGFAVLGLVGWWDDRVSLSAAVRFVVQLTVSGYLLGCAGVLDGIGLAGALATAVFLVWTTNLYNFMDGSNGMAGGQAVFAGLVLAWLFARAGDEAGGLLSLSVACAAGGFLPWNLGRPRVFMGDVGSGALGFAFGSLLVWGWLSGAFTAAVAWLVMLVFICDSTLTLLERVLKQERWYTPHKQHLYQQLIQRGWSHGRVFALYQGINLVLVTPAIAVAVNFPAFAWAVASVMTLALVLGWMRVRLKLGVLAQAG
jgi:Fuc2NAc and GlcNAc transferase